ncbi:unnamed protein product [Rangifer tarandus platyrhynchus]|uniref:Uncharacterized protein n=1 Tax=Rangifer tarandus platyrhynchus TaxID=3082113 RepID=A0ABN8ZB35_RANTA|nr:unnamed protein product [Rangifer tarandus platyrhynchus]
MITIGSTSFLLRAGSRQRLDQGALRSQRSGHRTDGDRLWNLTFWASGKLVGHFGGHGATNHYYAVPVAQVVKSLPAMQFRPGFNPWVGKIPWRREWKPILVFLPGEFYGQRSLAIVHGIAKSQTQLSD